jgi:hypothetical protein
MNIELFTIGVLYTNSLNYNGDIHEVLGHVGSVDIYSLSPSGGTDPREILRSLKRTAFQDTALHYDLVSAGHNRDVLINAQRIVYGSTTNITYIIVPYEKEVKTSEHYILDSSASM